MLCTVCATPQLEASPQCRSCGNGREPLPEGPEAFDRPVWVAPSAPPSPDGGLLPARLVPRRDGLDHEPGMALARSPLVVGRGSHSGGPVDVDLTHAGAAASVSRRHALLYFDQGAWWVQDLGSANGTYARRRGEAAFERCREAMRLEAGDEVAFGDQVFVLRGVAQPG